MTIIDKYRRTYSLVKDTDILPYQSSLRTIVESVKTLWYKKLFTERKD